MKTYTNVSGRVLRDREGRDWPSQKSADLDPAAHTTKGLLAYGLIREDGKKPPAPTPPREAPTPDTDTGAVAVVAPTEPPYPIDPEPQPTTEKAPARRSNK